jgi:hypothetical protein
MSTELAHPSSPGLLIQDRALETLIGAAVGVAVVLSMYYRGRSRLERPISRG